MTTGLQSTDAGLHMHEIRASREQDSLLALCAGAGKRYAAAETGAEHVSSPPSRSCQPDMAG